MRDDVVSAVGGSRDVGIVTKADKFGGGRDVGAVVLVVTVGDLGAVVDEYVWVGTGVGIVGAEEVALEQNVGGADSGWDKLLTDHNAVGGVFTVQKLIAGDSDIVGWLSGRAVMLDVELAVIGADDGIVGEYDAGAASDDSRAHDPTGCDRTAVIKDMVADDTDTGVSAAGLVDGVALGGGDGILLDGDTGGGG